MVDDTPHEFRRSSEVFYDILVRLPCMRIMEMLVATLMTFVDRAVPTDEEAQRAHPYIRRHPTCMDRTAPIGRTLHQVWWQGVASVPVHFEANRRTWARNHPSWDLKLWDEVSVSTLVNTSVPASFAARFHALPTKIQKADAARYAILHAEGGLYADMDIESVASLDELLGSMSGVGPTRISHEHTHLQLPFHAYIPHALLPSTRIISHTAVTAWSVWSLRGRSCTIHASAQFIRTHPQLNSLTPHTFTLTPTTSARGPGDGFDRRVTQLRPDRRDS